MCCNSLGDCYPKDDSKLMKHGIKYTDLLWMVFVGIFGACWIAHMFVFYCKQYDTQRHDEAEIELAKEYALDTIGRDSVYRFFVGQTWQGWLIALVILLAQFWVLFIFVMASELNLADDKKDIVFTWKCPRDDYECRDTIGMCVTSVPDFLYCILVFANLSLFCSICLKDRTPQGT